MVKHLKTFWQTEDGAVTVDWVVLTAAVAALAVSAMYSIYNPTGNVGGKIGTYLTGIDVGP